MKQIILGTAGHIDHGKTSLIKALTGTNTDRLKEERERGITIELGFAALDLPSGLHLGIVDVPGHEKFIKNMVAGATGIDVVTMIIAADEGVMPQTREHMEICTLLGVQHGLVALTKMDMVDEEWLELAKDDVEQFIDGTFLEGAPVVPVSSVSGEGLDDFVKALDSVTRDITVRPPSGLFRLPVDRVFTMKGFGTVITGTLISGQIRVGDATMLYPSKTPSKVRGIQVHNNAVEMAGAGMRTAINFQGLEKTAVNRGDIVSTPGALSPSYMLDVSLLYLSSNKKPAKNRAPVRVHTGTSEIMGRLILLEGDEVAPGQTVIAQLRLEAPVSVVRDDRFVIRSSSPARTIGGGRILNPIPVKHKRFKQNVITGLKQLTDKTPEELIEFHAEVNGVRGVSFSDLTIMTNLSEKALSSAMSGLLSRRVIINSDKENRTYVHTSTIDKLKEDTTNILAAFHKKYPLKQGLPKEEMRSRYRPALENKLYNLLLNTMVKEGLAVMEEETIRLTDHKVSLAVDQKEVRAKILQIYAAAGLTPPFFSDAVAALGIAEDTAADVFSLLVDGGDIVKVKEKLYFHAKAVDELRERLVAFLKENGEITTPQFKEMTGISRKYLIPLIEYYDAKYVTLRIGDIRKLRKG